MSTAGRLKLGATGGIIIIVKLWSNDGVRQESFKQPVLPLHTTNEGTGCTAFTSSLLNPLTPAKSSFFLFFFSLLVHQYRL